MKKQKRSTPLPDETAEELRARLRQFVLATRERDLYTVTIAMPEDVTVLAGPLRKVRNRANQTSVDSEQSSTCDPEPGVKVSSNAKKVSSGQGRG
jgi:hypothetical protein